MTTFEAAFIAVSKFVTPMWVELSFMMFFLLGFIIFGRGRKGNKFEGRRRHHLHKQLEADAAAGQNEAVLKTWHGVKALAPAPLDMLKNIVTVLLEDKPETLVDEMMEHFTAHRHALCNAKNSTAVLDIVARAGRADLLDTLANSFKQKLLVQHTFQTYEVLLGGHASAGNEHRVSELLSEMQGRQKVTARGYSLTIKGYLKNGMVDAALRQIQAMHEQGFFVPSFAVGQLFRTACQKDRALEFFEAISDSLPIPPEGLVALLEDCQKHNDLGFALRVEKHARDKKTSLPIGAYDALLKICVMHGDPHATDVFQIMQQESLRISEGLCVGLLARCAESKFLRFAQEIAKFVRERDGMTIGVYSALMKVYAYCGMYDDACDLYAEIKRNGMEPDNMMYGCLMKFSVECGRTELSRELFEKAPTLDIQNYMSLIRAASRDKDVDRAFAVLDKLKASGVSADIAAYNCVLDACVSAGDTKRARALMAEMQTFTTLDVITYNTLLKGYCSRGDVHGAKSIFNEISKMGLQPNDVSYNCLINAAVSAGNFKEAWGTIEMMESSGVAVDHFTISIMMKALKRVKDPQDVDRALALLDRSGIDVCSDEVLLNTVLETCTRHRQLSRLEGIVDKFTNANIRPSVHTYGSLIKACSTLKHLDKCRQLWSTLVEVCALQPNDIVLGCMLDALVCNGKVEEAVSLLQTWKRKIPPNTVMYSTIIKGFANSRQAVRALDMWKEMVDSGLKLNTVVYNALVDSQARVGAMDEVSRLVESMVPNGCTPDSITYSTIVKGYCVKGDPDKAFEVFRSMQTNGMAVDAVVYNTVIDGCTRQNRTDLADLVLMEMEKNKIKPSSFTLGILMKMYGRRRQLDKAFQVIEEFPKKYGLRINAQVRTCLISACLANQDFDRAMKVFEDMKQADGGADAKAYGSLLSGLARHGHVERAARLVEDAYGLTPDGSGKRGLPAGQVLDTEPLEQLIRALQQRRLMQSVGVPLLERLRAARVPVSGRLFSSTMHK